MRVRALPVVCAAFGVVLLLGAGLSAQDALVVGTVEHVIEDYPTHAIERRTVVLSDGRRLQIRGRSSLRTGQRVSVAEASIAADHTVESSALVVTSFVAAAVPTTSHLDIVLVNWTGAQWATLTRAQTDAAAINTRYRAMSDGQFGWNATVHPWVTIAPPPSTSCNYTWVMSAALNALTARGDPASGPHVQVWMEYYQACAGWSGLAYVGGTQSWLNGGSRSAVHELGHNLGLPHARFRPCAAGTCTTEEYGDPYDPMGGGDGWGPAHFGAYFKFTLGWVQPQTVTTSGDYALAPYEPTSSAVRSLRIPFGTNDFSSYYVESRASNNGDVLLHGPGDTLLDMDPMTSAQVTALAPGQMFVLPNGTQIVTVNKSTAGAVVRVFFMNAGPAPATQLRAM